MKVPPWNGQGTEWGRDEDEVRCGGGGGGGGGGGREALRFVTNSIFALHPHTVSTTV